MPGKRVTVQDIANALGLSRNTVSKVLNGTGSISDKTRSAILNKAAEMNYKQFAEMAHIKSPLKNRCIALLSHSAMPKTYFGSRLVTGFEKIISEKGYTLSMFIVRENEYASLTLPSNFDKHKVDAIICTEIFDEQYSSMLCELGKPILFADMHANVSSMPLEADGIIMENRHSTYRMVKTLIKAGLTKLSFVGDRSHCLSFRERWEGLTQALSDASLTSFEPANILDADSPNYHDPIWLEKRCQSISQFPEAFICANDFIAISLMRVLKARGLRIPQDLLITGFDDSMEASIVEPKLTTVHIYSEEMGALTAQMLLNRIENPSLIHHICYVKTTPIFRASTGSITDKADFSPPAEGF